MPGSSFEGGTRSASAETESARDAACRRLTLQASVFPDLEPGGPETRGLDPRDAALAGAIYTHAVRRWVTLEYLLDQRLKQAAHRLEPALRAVLLAGSAQLFFLDRVPAHAAINEAVGWAKRRVRPGAGGLVNAVLRRMSELIERDPDGNPVKRDAWSRRRDELPLGDGTALALTTDALPQDEARRFAIACGLRGGVIERWSEQSSPVDAQARALHALVEPPVVLNLADAPKALGDERVRTHERSGHGVYAGAHGELAAFLADHPGSWVQDPSSSATVESVRDLNPRLVLDACAGRGTKTRQLLAAFPDAEVVASDASEERMNDLRRGFGTDPRVRVVARDELSTRVSGADLILLDVPCSNSGVLARRVEARHRLGSGARKRLVRIQREIIEHARPLLAPGGTLLYATCSVDRVENEDQTRWAASLGLRLDSEQRVEIAGLPGDPPERYTDASYAARLGN